MQLAYISNFVVTEVKILERVDLLNTYKWKNYQTQCLAKEETNTMSKNTRRRETIVHVFNH